MSEDRVLREEPGTRIGENDALKEEHDIRIGENHILKEEQDTRMGEDSVLMKELNALIGTDRVLQDEPLKSHTTFQAGGPARFFVKPENADECRKIIALCRQASVPFFVMGNGSNLLVGDLGYQGLILSTERLLGITVEGNLLRAGSGVKLSAMAAAACKAGLSGLEFASGIPGSVGGAVYMNAGAYGGEMVNVLTRVRLLTPEGEEKWVPASEMGLGYRESRLMKTGEVVLEAEVCLSPGEQAEIRAKMDDLNGRRREKQPLEYPSAGSTFKRPEGYFAGKLIEDAGLKGYRVGGACVSEKHAGFVINDRHASAADILAVCEHVQKTVENAYGVKLAMEVKILGDFC